MDKRNKQFSPAPDFIRPGATPDAGKESAEDFARRLAALLHAQTPPGEAAAKQRPHSGEAPAANDTLTPSARLSEASQAAPDQADAPSAALESELAALLDVQQDDTASVSASELFAPPSGTPKPPKKRSARRKHRPAAPQGVELRPARLELTPSAQELHARVSEELPAQDALSPSEADWRLRSDLSDVPFAPPEKDPSLDELFHLSATEEAVDALPDTTDEKVGPASPEILQAPTQRLPDELKEAADLAAQVPAKLTQAPENPQSDDEPDSLAFLVGADAASEEVPVPAPQPSESTDPLPSLDDLFGPSEAKVAPTEKEVPAPAETELPAAPEAESVAPQAQDSPAPTAPPPTPSGRLGRLRSLLRSLFAPPEQEPDVDWDDSETADAPNTAVLAKTAPVPEPTSAPACSLAASASELPPAPAEDVPATVDASIDAKLEKNSPAEPAKSAPQEEASEEALPGLEQLFSTEPVSVSESAPAPEPSPEPKPAPIPEPTRGPRNPTVENATTRKETLRPQKRNNSTAMRLDELMAAAIPIEEAEPPAAPPPPAVPAGQSGEHVRRRAKKQTHASTPTATAVAAAASAAREAAAARTAESFLAMEAALAEANVPVPNSSARADTAGKTRRTPAPRRKEEKIAAPVPSADARKQASASHEVKHDARPRQGHDAPPQEEPATLHPDEAYRQYAKPLDLIGTRLILTGMFTFLSLFFTLYLSRRWSFLPEVFSGGVTIYLQFALLFFTVLINCKLLFRRQRGGSASRISLLLGFAAIFTAADCFRAATELRSPFTVVFGALMIVFLWGEYDRGMAMTTTVKVLRAGKLSAGVSEVSEIGRDGRGLIRAKPNADRFMEKLETRDLTARVLRIYAPTAACCALALTLLISLGLKRDLAWTGALIFLGSVPASGLLAYPRLFLLLSRRLAEADAALCGYHGAEVFGGDHAILIGDEDIFPAGSLTLNGFKVYNNNPDRIIAYAAAAARCSASALDPVFDDLLVTHNGRQYPVDSFRFYDSGGIGASIGEDVVLMGSLEFMRRMGVHMDKGAKVRQAVYMSLNGELAAVFAIRYAPPDNLRKGLASIAANRHFKGILVTRTFLGTPGFLKAKFGIPAETFHYPATAERIRLSEAERKRTGAQGAILAKDSFSGFAQAVAAGRMLRSATLGAAIMTVLNGLTGLLLMGVLAFLPARETATALSLLIYSVIWLVPALLLSVWGRHF